MNKLVFPTTLFIVFLIFLAGAVTVSAADAVCQWQGNMTIDGLRANSSHIITSYTDSASETNGTVYDTGQPTYIIIVPDNTSSSTNVTFYVCGIYASDQGEQNWICDSSNDYLNRLDLTVTSLVSGASCTYDCGCNDSANLHCADDYDGTGSWCTTTNSCMHNNASTANAGTTCSDTSTKQTCTNGAWVSETCAYGCSSGACSSAPSGGSTGGTGGAGSSVVSESILAGTGSSGQTLTSTYTKSDDLKIQEISVELKDSVTNAYIQVKESSLPSGASVAISSTEGATYKYLEITKTHMTDDDIESAAIKFKVSKSWITSQSIDKSTIALSRYDSGSWTKYSATILSEDDTYVYYTVDVPGLSVFVITGEKVVGAAVCTADAKTCVGDDLQQCKSDGSAWETLETCAYGCEAGACKSEPVPCTADAKQCVGDDLQQCSEAGVWETLETCAYGCDAANLVCNSEPAPVCTAGARKCVGSNNLQQCKSDGSGWETTQTCTHGCDAATKACKSAPPAAPAIPIEYIAVIAIVVIILLAAIGLYLRKGPKK